MKALAFAIATIALAGCATPPCECTCDEPATQRTLVILNDPVAPAALVAPVAPASASVLAGEDEIRPDCEEEWSDNWSGVALCVRMGTEGFREVQRFVDEHRIREGDTTPEAKILSQCFREWRDNNGNPNWSGVSLCTRMQWDGYKELNP